MHEDTQKALAEIIAAADSLAEIKLRTGRNTPDAIT
jgi:hypothetical protein